MKLNDYINEAEDVYFAKKLKQADYAKNIVLTSKNRKYTLEEVNSYKDKIKSAIINNEINSIHRVLDKKIVIFPTRTILPKYNIPKNVTTVKEVDRHIKFQYEQLKNYHHHINQFKMQGNRLNKQYVRLFDLSDELNLHSHNIDILNSKMDLEHYIKSLVLAKKKCDIGRVELIITEYSLKHIKRLFNDFKIRVNNKYKKLTLKQVEKEYYIKGTGCKDKEGVYFKLLTKQKNSKLNLIRYFYKNILKERYMQEPTKEHSVFSKLGIRIKQFSKDFFNCKIQKHILYRTNNKLLSMVRNKVKDIQLSPSVKDLKNFLFYTASLFRKSILRSEEYESERLIYYVKDNKPTTQWIHVVNLKTYEKEGFEESFGSNGDLYRQEVSMVKLDKNIKYFYRELEVKNIQLKSRFLKQYQKKEFFIKKLISDIWIGYLKYLHYEIRKIRFDKYMEELIYDFCIKKQRRLEIFDEF